MTCPLCTAPTEVVDTRTQRDWVRRRRRCLNTARDDCGVLFTTHEVIVRPTQLRTVANRPLRD